MYPSHLCILCQHPYAGSLALSYARMRQGVARRPECAVIQLVSFNSPSLLLTPAASAPCPSCLPLLLLPAAQLLQRNVSVRGLKSSCVVYISEIWLLRSHIRPTYLLLTLVCTCLRSLPQIVCSDRCITSSHSEGQPCQHSSTYLLKMSTVLYIWTVFADGGRAGAWSCYEVRFHSWKRPAVKSLTRARAQNETLFSQRAYGSI